MKSTMVSDARLLVPLFKELCEVARVNTTQYVHPGTLISDGVIDIRLAIKLDDLRIGRINPIIECCRAENGVGASAFVSQV